MRILKVEFKNLNSLAGQWSVDFRHPDYESCGLFLITGPTGSGKTTLLDAICLALYGRTPRISISKTHNEIMTRHTGECWAEATFETDRGIFRARLSQSRANKKPGGNLQDIKRELVDESAGGALVENNPTLVNEKIVQITGLNYKQFTRAIMLAQSNFSAFLESSEDEKAFILEKLTDSSIYTELSFLAFNKSKAETNALNDLLERADKLAILDPQEEKLKKEELAQREITLRKLEAEIAAAGKAAQWLERLEQLARAGRQLLEQKEELDKAVANFKPLATELANARMAAPHEGIYAALLELRKNLAENKRKYNILQEKHKELAAKVEQCSLRMQILQAEKDMAEVKREQALPLLKEARELDVLIFEKNKELANLRGLIAQKRQQLENERKNLKSSEIEHDKLEARSAETAAWLEKNAADAWLVENFNAIAERFASIGELEKQTAAGRAQMEREEKNLAALDKKLAAEKASIGLGHKKSESINSALANAASRRDSALCGSALEDLRKLLDANRKRQKLQAVIQSLEEKRARLHDGEACPLCGATDHPWAKGNVPVEDGLEKECHALELRIRNVENLEREMAEREKELAIVEHELKAAETRVADLQSQINQCSGRMEECRAAGEETKNILANKQQSLFNELASLGISQKDENPCGILRMRREKWLETRGIKEEIEIQRRDLTAKIAAAKAACEIAGNDFLTRQGEESALVESISGLAEKRKTFFGGKSADEAESSLNNLVNDASKALLDMRGQLENLQTSMGKSTGEQNALQHNIEDLTARTATAQKKFEDLLAENSLDENSFLAMRKPHDRIADLEKQERDLAAWETRVLTSLDMNQRDMKAEKEKALTDKDLAALNEMLAELSARRDAENESAVLLRRELSANENNRGEAAHLAVQIANQRKETEKWQLLNGYIGSADGKDFRKFAQSVTLDILLDHANSQLEKISDRYLLRRVDSAKSNMEIEVVDNYQAGEARTIKNLSGGEVFLASLALSLGLSAMSGKNAVLGSLFLDEGFGTLDSDTLETAWQAIASLRHEGKLIGIISHVETLRDKIPARIQVRPLELGHSELEGPGCKRVK